MDPQEAWESREDEEERVGEWRRGRREAEGVAEDKGGGVWVLLL
jgi:hypothetical protein